jgi:hypothetical protein
MGCPRSGRRDDRCDGANSSLGSGARRRSRSWGRSKGRCRWSGCSVRAAEQIVAPAAQSASLPSTPHGAPSCSVALMSYGASTNLAIDMYGRPAFTLAGFSMAQHRPSRRSRFRRGSSPSSTMGRQERSGRRGASHRGTAAAARSCGRDNRSAGGECESGRLNPRIVPLLLRSRGQVFPRNWIAGGHGVGLGPRPCESVSARASLRIISSRRRISSCCDATVRQCSSHLARQPQHQALRIGVRKAIKVGKRERCAHNESHSRNVGNLVTFEAATFPAPDLGSLSKPLGILPIRAVGKIGPKTVHGGAKWANSSLRLGI